MIDWTQIVVRGIVALVAALGLWAIIAAARRSGKTEQRLQDELAGERAKAEIVENSNAVSEAAAARSDPRVHDVPTFVPDADIPGWLKRD